MDVPQEVTDRSLSFFETHQLPVTKIISGTCLSFITSGWVCLGACLGHCWTHLKAFFKRSMFFWGGVGRLAQLLVILGEFTLHVTAPWLERLAQGFLLDSIEL